MQKNTSHKPATVAAISAKVKKRWATVPKETRVKLLAKVREQRWKK